MEVIVTTAGELRNILRTELESLKGALSPLPANQHKKELFQTRKEAAKTLRISLQTLHSWTANGTIKSYSIGGRILYKTEDLEAAVTEVRKTKY